MYTPGRTFGSASTAAARAVAAAWPPWVSTEWHASEFSPGNHSAVTETGASETPTSPESVAFSGSHWPPEQTGPDPPLVLMSAVCAGELGTEAYSGKRLG